MLALSLPFKRILFALALFVTFALYPSLGRSESPRKTTRATLPVLFEPNRGQAPSWARYIARTLEGEVSLASDRIEITQPRAAGGQNFDLRFNGANPREFHEEASKDGSANYYFGGQNMRSIEHVPLYRTVRYGQLYPGIDLVFHGRDGRLEYDFAVAPDASTEPLRIDLADAEQAETQDDGSLLITSNGHSIRLLAPQAFQRLGEQTVPVQVAYRLLSPHCVRFKLGPYDRTRQLTIDPVVSYAETVNVSNSTSVAAVAADANGDLIMTGSTFANDYLVIDGQPASPAASEEVFVTKFDPTGENVIYSTYLPAAGFNTASAIAVDQAGNAFIAGVATDPSFPVTSHELGTCSDFCNAGFVTKLDPSGAMLYSTLLGSGQLLPKALVIDTNGNALVSGLAADGSLQTVNAYQAAYLGGLCTSCYSAFFAKLNATGTGYVFASYLGAGNNATGVALDGSGNVYVAGTADSVPETREGVSALVSNVFWDLVAVARANPKIVERPGGWAVGQILRWVSEFGLSFLEVHGTELKHFKHLQILLIEQADYFGPTPSEVFNREARKPLLQRLEEAKLNRAKVHDLIWKDFNSLALAVFQARIAVLVKGKSTATVLREFAELAPLAPGPEIDNVLLRDAEPGEREDGAARRIAADLAEVRCGLKRGTILRYAQPGKPKAKHQKQN